MHKFAVIELFTAEECSECVIAEEMLPGLREKYKGNLFVLQFHVDYEDQQGWKDRFAQKQFAERQRNYTYYFNTQSVYTPQAVINGRKQVNAAHYEELKAKVDEEMSDKKLYRSIGLQAKLNNDTILVRYNSKLAPNEYLYLALVQKEGASQVKNGTNVGKALKHQYIVRDFKTMLSEYGEKKIALPRDLFGLDCYIIAYIQNTDDMSVAGIQQVKIE